MRGSPGWERDCGGSRQPDAMELLKLLRPDEAELLRQVLLAMCLSPKLHVCPRQRLAVNLCACGVSIRNMALL